MKLGVFGGTFNPIHLGHLLLAEAAAEALALDRVLFIPAATPPHKRPRQLANARDRLRMVRLAIRGNDRFRCSDMEIRRDGPSYSVETLRHLRRLMPGARFFFLIGTDSLRELHTWKEASALARLCEFICVLRPGERAGRSRLRGLRVHHVHGHPTDISSSDIRARLARGASVRYLMPEPVRRYIQKKRLYRT
ncbi:MAG: nicotinate-nucleotide adenylyltransferase [Verrucomicrobiae bacterium]|nr:nicotinate-nucleotide adenylyltransferase [Verrucomicrobiae bacterium]